MTAYAGGGTLFRSTVERTTLFYLLAASAVIGPAFVLALAVGYFWPQSRDVSHALVAAAGADFALTLFIAFALRRVDVTFDGRRVRLGSSIFKTSVPVGEIVAAEAETGTGGGPFRSAEYIKLVTTTGAHRVPCRNAETLAQLIEYHRAGGG